MCSITALAMIGATFTLLEEKMPLRARLHVIEVYGPDVLLDLSTLGSQSAVELLPLDNGIANNNINILHGLQVLSISIDEVSAKSTLGKFESTSEITPNDSSRKEKYLLFDDNNWGEMTKNVYLTVTTRPSLIQDDSTQPFIRDNSVPHSSSGARGQFWCHSGYHDVAFVDWTSGSTGGLPKGCYCKHSTLSNMLYEKYFSPTSLFDQKNREVVGVNLFNLWYWWQPICAGHTTALLLSTEVTDITLLFQSIVRFKITAMDCITPSLLQTMLYCRSSSPEFYVPATMIVGGEMLTLTCARQFYNDQLSRYENSDGLHGQVTNNSRLINLFSTTETGDCSYFHVTPKVIEELVAADYIHCPIGTAIGGIDLNIDAVGDKGLIVGGADTDHYLSDAVTTEKYFDSRGWLSYDQASYITVGGERIIMLTGRSDDCVKVRGFKVDLNAVEEAITMSETVVMVSVQHHLPSDSLVAFVVLKAEFSHFTSSDPTGHPCLKYIDRLPKSHTPQVIEVIPSMPIGRTGKVNRKVVMEDYLKKIKSEHEQTQRECQVEGSPVAVAVRSAWKQILNWTGGLEKSFWDCGGHSLLAMQMCAKLSIPSALLFGGNISTAQEMIDYLESRDKDLVQETDKDHIKNLFSTLPTNFEEPVAIVGMSGRWPGIGQTSCDDLFNVFTSETKFEPFTSAPTPSGLGNVRKGFYLDNSLLTGFDCNFWNMTKDDALLCDPQLRSFLEMSYEAFCDAGVAVEPKVSDPLNCGVFASSGSLPHYLELLLDGKTLSEIRATDPAKYFNLELGNDRDYLATRLAYIFNLVGPTECIQTACSSGLVAVSRAVEAIRSGQCEIAIAGGVSIFSPQQEHAHMPDLIWSADGRCRPFDAKASGTANCNGGQVFLLKSLSAAIRDGDSIYGCVKGSAVRNDGRLGKRNFNAPSSVGYVRTVEAALKNAGLVDTSGIRMLEAHGTGTIVGDPIEMAGITQSYGIHNNSHPLSVGSVKGNIGHANTAAGPMSMAKTVMCIFRDRLVPTGNFTSCSDSITHEMHKSKRPIEIQISAAKFEMVPRMGGVSAIGIGGTCAHLILEQAPKGLESPIPVHDDGVCYYLPISAASPAAMHAYTEKLVKYTQQNKEISTASLCSTLGNHRPQLKYRRLIVIPPHHEVNSRDVVCSALNDSLIKLPALTTSMSRKSKHKSTVVLVFPGQGIDLPKRMTFPSVILETLGYDPLVKYWEGGCTDIVLYQLAMFCVHLKIGLDVVASLGSDINLVGLGHSLGEWVVATLCGLLNVEEAIMCVKARAEILVRHTAGGGMICVCASLDETLDALKLLDGIDVEVSCINSDDRIVLSGSRQGCEEFSRRSKLICKKVDTDCAFHSKFVDKGMSDLENTFESIMSKRSRSISPNWTMVSSFSCKAVVTETATPSFWANQTRGCVNFAKAISVVGDLAGTEAIWLLSFGVSKSLCSKPPKLGLICVRNDNHEVDVKAAMGRVWELGINVKMDQVVGVTSRVLSLPAYAWDREHCWPALSDKSNMSSGASSKVLKHESSQDIRHTLFKEAWLPVGKSSDRSASFDLPFPVSHISLLNRNSIDKNDSIDSFFQFEVESCLESILTNGRLVICVGTCDDFSDTGGTTPINQCYLLSRFLFLIQSVLNSSDCLQALHSALPHEVLSSRNGGIILILDESDKNWEAAGAVLGAARCVANEHPELHFQIVRTMQSTEYHEVSSIFFCSDFPKGEYRYRQHEGDGVTVRTMLPMLQGADLDNENEVDAIEDGGVYVVSGGLGALGKLVAAWLCCVRNAKSVFLLTRKSQVDLEDEALLSFGNRIQVVQGDICNFASLSKCVGINWQEVTGVVHCAGDVFDSLVKNTVTDISILKDQILMKTLGFANLLALVKTTTEFICFSSASGSLGSLGQLTYCAANVALDVMVDTERSRSGRPIVSIQWGGWSKSILGSMSDKYNVDPAGSFESFYTAKSGIDAMSSAIRFNNINSETAVCMALDVNCWESYVSSTGVSKSLMSMLLMAQRRVRSTAVGTVLLPFAEQLLCLPQWRWLGDHKANSQIIFPATASLELLMKNRSSNRTLHDVSFSKTIYAGDTLTVNDLSIENDNGECVRALSSSSIKAGSLSLPPTSSMCITLAAISILKSPGDNIKKMYSPEIYHEMSVNGFDYGPDFALVSSITTDCDLNIAIGHVKGGCAHKTVESDFPLAPELDACAHVCIALDKVVASAYPVAVENFTIQSIELKSIDSFDHLQRFYDEHSVSDDDWVVICRQHCSKIELEFDIVCLRKSDSCVISFERFCLKALPRAVNQGDLSSCVFVQVDEATDVPRTPSLKLVSLDGVVDTPNSQLDTDTNEDFEVDIDADYKPTFNPLPTIQYVPDDHIVVRVTTYALNFLDVLSASGMMPKEYFGGECVGVVECVGTKVSRLKVGDRVALLLLGQGMKSRLCVPQFLASPPLPARISDEEAATIPVAYATAWLALEWMGRIKDGETALVHSAAGGVGLACVSILKSHDCRVFATCSPGKEAALEALGVESEDIFHSRVPNSWLSGCMKALQGKPDISLCLGAFVGESLSLSLNLMAPLGRVLDFGKRDQLEQTALNMAPFLKGLTYSAAHLDELMTTDYEGTERLLNEVWSSLYDKVYPLQYELFSVKDTQAAVSRLASGQLVGKVVIRFPQKHEPAWEILNSPAWTVAVGQCEFSSDSKDMFDQYLRRLGGSVHQENVECPPPSVYLNCSLDSFPLATDACTNHPRTVVISKEMSSSISLYVQCCAAACQYAALHLESNMFLCTNKNAVLSTGCIPPLWRNVAKEIKSLSSEGAQVGVLEWLLSVVGKSTGLNHDDLLQHSLDELGFDSLSCLQLSHKLQQAFPDKSSFQIPGHVVIKEIFDSGAVIEGNNHIQTTNVLTSRTDVHDSKPRKWLALHGFRMNRQIFRFQLENIINEVDSMLSDGDKLFTIGSVDFPDAPLTAMGPGEEGLKDLYISIISSTGDSSDESINMPLFEWWRSGVANEGYDTAWIGHHGLAESFQWLQARVKREEYAGVIGMSQGAGMAYLLTLTGAVPRGLLFSPVGPDNCKAFAKTLIDSAGVSLHSPPLLVVWDPSDTPSEEFIQDVIKQGPMQVEEVHHDGGHIVPQDVSTGKYAKKRHVAEAVVKWLKSM